MVTCPLCHGEGRINNSLAQGGWLTCILCDGGKMVDEAVAVHLEVITGHAQAPPKQPTLFDEGDWK